MIPRHIGLAVVIVSMLCTGTIAALIGQAEEIVYQVQLRAGHWHVWMLPSGWVGALVWSPAHGHLNVFRWDVSTRYIIFYSPFTGNAYIVMSNVENPILDTSSWFPGRPVVLNITVAARVLRPDGSTFMDWQREVWIIRQVVSSSVSRSFSPTVGVTVVNTSTFTWSQSYTLPFLGTSSFASTSTQYTVHAVMVTNASTAQSLTLNVTSLCASVGGYRYGVWSQYQHYWAASSTTMVSTTYTTASNVTTNRNSIVNRGARVTTASSTSPYSDTFHINLLEVWYSARVVQATASTTRVYTIQDGVITAANGNRIVLITSWTTVGVVRSSQASLILYGARYSVTRVGASANFLAMNISLPGNVVDLNPAIYVPEVGAVLPTYYFTSGNRLFIIAISDLLHNLPSYTAYVVFSFPRFIAESYSYTPEPVAPSSLFLLLSGTIYGADTVVFVNAEATSMRDGDLVLLKLYNLSSRRVNMPMISIVGPTRTDLFLLKWNSFIVGNFSLGSSALRVAPPMYISADGDVEIRYSYQAEGYFSLPLPFLLRSLVALPSGSWGYRMPIYITLQSGAAAQPVVRLEIPLGVYIRQGILSPAVEDLIFADASGTPLLFHIPYWKDQNTAVVYVRLAKPHPPGTVTIFMYMYNRNLWGTGNSYQSIQTYDFVNPELPHPVAGIWNGYSLYSCRWVRVYTTSHDHLTIHTNGTAVECHGTLCTRHSIPPIPPGAREIHVIVRGDSVWLFADGEPQFSVDLSSFGDFPKTGFTSITFVSFDAKTAYVFHTSDYIYSVGGIQGAVAKPAPAVNQQQQQVVQPPSIDWFSMFMMVFLLLALGIVVRLVQGGSGGGGGGPLSRL